jgi:hypothetical protein
MRRAVPGRDSLCAKPRKTEGSTHPHGGDADAGFRGESAMAPAMLHAPCSSDPLAALRAALAPRPILTRITVSPLAMPRIQAQAAASGLSLTPACVELRVDDGLAEHAARLAYSDGSEAALCLRTGKVTR